nr:C13 family peptidase [Coralloluteibacterium stylophorae]
MDVDEDILLLFATSHGSADHRLYVDLPPLPLAQVSPRMLREALDEAGIRWRVVVVSACFSGGFVDALAAPRTLVITAARADRSSFGCGAEADITWFGDAFLVHGLNRTSSLPEAFRIAREQVAAWEAREGETPSEPQYVAGRRIEAHLARWRRTLDGHAPPVPFAPPAHSVQD